MCTHIMSVHMPRYIAPTSQGLHETRLEDTGLSDLTPVAQLLGAQWKQQQTHCPREHWFPGVRGLTAPHAKSPPSRKAGSHSNPALRGQADQDHLHITHRRKQPRVSEP